LSEIEMIAADASKRFEKRAATEVMTHVCSQRPYVSSTRAGHVES
jgi:hypothetical protein